MKVKMTMKHRFLEFESVLDDESAIMDPESLCDLVTEWIMESFIEEEIDHEIEQGVD